MRKTTTKKIAITSTHKKATVVKGTRVAKPVLTEQEKIDKAIKAMEGDDKELELLKRELEKPMKQRNQALMAKWGILDSSRLKDNYPDLNKGVNYEMIINFPEDDGIKAEDRPKLWYVGLGIEWKGNKFNFRFPIHVSTYLDGQNLYKLDGFNVYVDHDGVIKNDISDYTIFQALTDYHAGTMRDGQVNDVFLQYKVIDKEDVDADIINAAVEKNFAIRGHGLFVTSKVIKGSNAATTTTVTSGNQLLQPFARTEASDDPLKAALYDREARAMEAKGGIPVPGLTVKLDPGVLTLTEVTAAKSTLDSTPRYIFLGYDPTHPEELSCVIAIGPSEGLRVAQVINPSTTKAGLVSMIRENNKSVYNRLIGDIEAEKERLDLIARKAEADKAAKAAKAAEVLRKKQEKQKEEAEKAAAEKAKADAIAAAKKAEADAAAAAEREVKRQKQAELTIVLDLLRGYKQPHGITDRTPITFFNVPETEPEKTTAEAHMNTIVDEVIDHIQHDGLRVPGINKAIKSGFKNKVVEVIAAPGDTADDPYFAILSISTDGETLETTVFCGYDSVRAELRRKKKTPIQLAEAVANGNIATLKKFVEE